MKTKDFIKMLQDEDPTGESHIRMNGGILVCVEGKPGYYDGAYEYFDDDGNWVVSTRGHKIDLWTKDMSDFVEDNENLSLEDLKKKMVFDVHNLDSYKSRYLSKLEEAYNENKRINEEIYNISLSDMKRNSNDGWTWFRSKDSNTWKIYDSSGKEMGTNSYMTECIVKSGLWEEVDCEMSGFNQWKFKE